MADTRKQIAAKVSREVKELLTILNKLESSGQAVVIGGISSELTDAKKKALIAQLRESAAVADGEVKDWLLSSISTAYVAGMNIADDLLSKKGFETAGGKITISVLKTSPDMQPHLQAVNALMSDAYSDFGSGITGWVKGSERILNDATRRQLQSKLALGRLEGSAIKEIKNEIAAVLERQGLRSLIDRGGRQWTLDRYGEMLTRTHLIKANTDATVNRMAQVGVDIVEVSTHGTEDEICLRYEGNIYSLSGKSENFEQLPEQPPFHPNCKHTLLPRPDLD